MRDPSPWDGQHMPYDNDNKDQADYPSFSVSLCPPAFLFSCVSGLSLCLSLSSPVCLFVLLCLSVLLSLRWEQFDKNYLSKLLLRKSVYRKSELWEAYQKINIRDAISVIDQVKGTEQSSL